MNKKNLLVSIGLVILAVAIAFLIKQAKEPQVATNPPVTENTSNTTGDKADTTNISNDVDKDTTEPKVDDTIPSTNENPDAVADAEKVAYKIYTNDEFDQVLAQDKPTIIMFGTKTCIYCRQMEPVFGKLSEQYADRITLKYVDAEELTDKSSQYPLRGVPAFMYQMNPDKPFLPSEETRKLGFYAYSEQGSEDVDLVMSYGSVEEETFIKFIEEMLANAE